MGDGSGKLRLRIESYNNSTLYGYIEDTRSQNIINDENGALYYVVAVILIYGLSIVMMIASHIRKNQQDNQLRTYLKEMAILRKKDRRDKLYSTIGTVLAASKAGAPESASDENRQTPMSGILKVTDHDVEQGTISGSGEKSPDSDDPSSEQPSDEQQQLSPPRIEIVEVLDSLDEIIVIKEIDHL